MNTLIIDSLRQKTLASNLVAELPEDSSKTVTIKNTDKSPTARQRRLRWLWMTEISQSGLGSYDTKEDVDLACKWMFARPILLRDDDLFAVVYEHFMKAIDTYVNKPHLIKDFCRNYISIEKLMSRKQEAEYLTELQRYWIQKGVGLTLPEMQGVNLDTQK